MAEAVDLTQDPYTHMLRVDVSPWTVVPATPIVAGPIRTVMAFLEDRLNAGFDGEAKVTITVEIPERGE